MGVEGGGILSGSSVQRGVDLNAGHRTVSVVEGISQGSTQLLEMRSTTTHSWNRNIAAKKQSIALLILTYSRVITCTPEER